MKIASWRPVRIEKILFAGLLDLAFQGQAAPLQLQINGSNTIGVRLAPLLVKGMLKEAGAQNFPARSLTGISSVVGKAAPWATMT